MVKHTPGPWVVTTCADYWVAAEDGAGIAHCGDIEWANHEVMQHEWEANARLIAASPDMLAALEAIEQFDLSWSNSMDTNVEGIKDIASAAIAKAKGESK